MTQRSILQRIYRLAANTMARERALQSGLQEMGILMAKIQVSMTRLQSANIAAQLVVREISQDAKAIRDLARQLMQDLPEDSEGSDSPND